MPLRSAARPAARSARDDRRVEQRPCASWTAIRLQSSWEVMARSPGTAPSGASAGRSRGWTICSVKLNRPSATSACVTVERAGREPARQDAAPAEQLQEIALAAEDQRAVARMTVSVMPTPRPTYSSSPVGPAKRLEEWMTCGKPLAARVEPRPDLAAAGHVLGDGHDARHMAHRASAAAGRRSAAAACASHQPGAAHPRFEDFAGIDDGAAAGEALAEAAADRAAAARPIPPRDISARKRRSPSSRFGPWLGLVPQAPGFPGPRTQRLGASIGCAPHGYFCLPSGRRLTIRCRGASASRASASARSASARTSGPSSRRRPACP